MDNTKSDVYLVWGKILSGIGGEIKEFKTVPKTNKQPIWFSAKRNGECISIDCAK